MFKKLVSLVLCMLISVTSVPIQALAQDVTQRVGFDDGMENLSKINVSSAGTVTLTQDKVSGKYAAQVSVGDEANQSYASYRLTESAPFDSSIFSQIKVSVKPAKGANWIEFRVKNSNGQESLIKNDKDGDGKFKVGIDLVSGKWNSVDLNLNKSSQSLTNISQLVVTTNEFSTWIYDEVKSVYAPTMALDMANYISNQTELVDGKIQFRKNSSGAFNTSPLVLTSNSKSTVSKPYFSRETPANNLNGTKVAAGTPRYTDGKYGQGIVIEEGTNNAVKNSSFDTYTTTSGIADNWLKGNTSGVTANYSVDSSMARVSGGKSQKISVTSSNGPGHAVVAQFIDVIPGRTYTWSMFVAGTVNGVNAKAKLQTYFYDANGNYLTNSVKYFMPKSSTFERVELTATVPTNAVKASVECGIDVRSAGETGTVNIDDVQVEEKSYATSYVDGQSTRAGEVLAFPTADVFNAKEGTIQFWVKFLSEKTAYQALFTTGQDSSMPRLLIMRDPWASNKITVWDGDGNSEVMLQSNTVPQNGQYYQITYTWSPKGRKFYINGNLESSSTRGHNIGVQSTAYIGKWSGGDNSELNGIIDDFRISNTQKTESEVLADYQSSSPLTVEASTTYKLAFDNSGEASSFTKGFTLPNGKVSSVSINSSYIDATLNQEISTLPKDRLYLSGVNPTQFDLSGDGNWVYYNTSTGLNMLNLIDGTNKPVASVTFSPAEVKVNYDGTKVALRDLNDNLYLYDDTTKTLKNIDSGVTFMAIANNGSLGYSKNTSNGPTICYVSPTGYIGSFSMPISYTTTGLDISKDGKDLFYAFSSSTVGSYTMGGRRYSDGRSYTIASHRTNGSISGLKTNGNGSMFFYKYGSNWYAYDVATKSVKKLNIEDASVVKDVTDDNKLMYRHSLAYMLYDCSVDRDVDTGIRDDVTGGYAISNNGNKIAYTSSTGLKVRYMDGSPRPERYLLSFDGKNSWQTYKNGTWSVVSTENVPTVSDLNQYGMTISEVNGLTEEDFASLYEGGKQIFAFDVAIKFASVDAYVTPTLKGITVTFSPNATNANDDQIINSLYTTKNSNEYDATKWRQIKRIYPIELQPKEAETYYFVYSDGVYYNFASNQLTPLSDQSLLSDVESNWIDITLQGLSVDQLRNLPTNALNSLLGKKFQVVYAMKVVDVTTEPYNSMITVDYVENQFESTKLVLQITLNNGQVKEYDLGKEKIEDFMVWLNDRQHNKGPIFYRIDTTSDDPGIVKVNGFVNYYDIQYVDVIEKE